MDAAGDDNDGDNVDGDNDVDGDGAATHPDPLEKEIGTPKCKHCLGNKTQWIASKGGGACTEPKKKAYVPVVKQV